MLARAGMLVVIVVGSWILCLGSVTDGELVDRVLTFPMGTEENTRSPGEHISDGEERYRIYPIAHPTLWVSHLYTSVVAKTPDPRTSISAIHDRFVRVCPKIIEIEQVVGTWYSRARGHLVLSRRRLHRTSLGPDPRDLLIQQGRKLPRRIL